jgi:hypothetical protein
MAFGLPSVQDIRAMNDQDLAKVLCGAKDREDQLLDAIKSDLLMVVAGLTKAGETHQLRIMMPADGKGGVVVQWEAKLTAGLTQEKS